MKEQKIACGMAVEDLHAACVGALLYCWPGVTLPPLRYLKMEGTSQNLRLAQPLVKAFGASPIFFTDVDKSVPGLVGIGDQYLGMAHGANRLSIEDYSAVLAPGALFIAILLVKCYDGAALVEHLLTEAKRQSRLPKEYDSYFVRRPRMIGELAKLALDFPTLIEIRAQLPRLGVDPAPFTKETKLNVSPLVKAIQKLDI